MTRTVAGGALALCLAIGVGLFASCKQQEGERCQIDQDCEDGYVCAPATKTCANPGMADPNDAMLPIDAPTDAPAPLDAPDAATAR